MTGITLALLAFSWTVVYEFAGYEDPDLLPSQKHVVALLIVSAVSSIGYSIDVLIGWVWSVL